MASCHRAAIGHRDQCSRSGGLFVRAMPRGTGKDTPGECAVLHALVYGRRRYAVLIGATESLAAPSQKKLRGSRRGTTVTTRTSPRRGYAIRRLDRTNYGAGTQRLGG